MFRKPAFFLVSFCEAWYGVFALLGIYTENIKYQFAFTHYIDDKFFFLLFIFFAILFIILYYFWRFNKYITYISVILSIFWLILLINFFYINILTVSIPLYIFMFLIRILISVMVEAERNGITN